jgi:uncharacterized protein YyaL (SSP411 family)
VCSVSCGKRDKTVATPSATIPEILRENRLGQLDGPVYQSLASSSIPWQPWEKDVLKAASEAGRLVLAVVVMPQQQDYGVVLSNLEKEPEIARAITENYVPVLIDGEMVREMGLLVNSLCREIGQQLQMPAFIWMTPEGDPVACIPINGSNKEKIKRLFLQSHEMVDRTWKDGPDYVRKTSKENTAVRRQRLVEIANGITASSEPAVDVLSGVRQLLSYYDPVSRTLDETGGVFPLGQIDVAVASATLPGMPESLRRRGRETAIGMIEDLLTSAMFDPLEGGVFSGRRYRSWSLPAFGWNCPDQAKVAASLFRAYHVTRDEMTLERASNVMDFAERRFLGEDGLFRFGAVNTLDPEKWMWTVTEIKEALPKQDARWWISATGMEELGNLSPEIDSSRRYFRMNTLSLRQSLEKTAAEIGADPSTFASTFRRSRDTLKEIREGRWKGIPDDQTPNASASFRMVSAYAAAFTATGNEIYRTKAKELLARSSKAFFSDGVLKSAVGRGASSVTDARAFAYALAAQAAQDTADITLDPALLAWAKTMALAVTTNFLRDGALVEASSSSAVLDLPLIDSHRVYDDTTGGVFALMEARSIGAGGEFQESLKKLSRPLPIASTSAPVLHSDVMIAALVKHHSRTIVLGDGLSPEMAISVSRLPLQWFPRAYAKDSDGIPTGSVRVISPDGMGKLIANPADLLKELYLSE